MPLVLSWLRGYRPTRVRKALNRDHGEGRRKLEIDMKIGVSGASGHLGRATVAELVQRPGGHEVLAISRTPETITARVQGRFGDYNQPESLADAYAGLDRLVIIPTIDREPGK